MVKYRDYKHAECDVGEMVVNIEGLWLKIEVQLESLQALEHVEAASPGAHS